MTRRRAGVAAGVLAVLAILVALAVAGHGDDHSVGTSPGGAGRTGLLAALAPAIEAAAPSAAAPASATAPASAQLAASAPRAAARLLLVGFGGSRPAPGVLRRLAAREWGGVVLEAGNGASIAQTARLIARIRADAVAAHHGTPIIVASQPGADGDAVAVGTPPEARIAGVATARRIARATGRALRSLGVRMVLAPSADTATAGGPWVGRAYSDDASTIGPLAAAAVQGFGDAHVAAAAGHFPGEGAASGDPALEPATVGASLAELQQGASAAFAQLAVAAPAIQLSAAAYAAYDGVTPATLLPQVVTLLRRDLRFGGVIVSGDLAAASLATGRPVAELAVEALRAGCDLLWVPGDADDQEAAWRAIVRGLRSGAIPVARVADALTRVSALRARYGVG